MKMGKHFTLSEFTRSDKAAELKDPNMPNEVEIERIKLLVKHILDPLREALGRKVVLTSGFRNDRVNRAVGGEPTSQHRLGEAADFGVEGMTSDEVVREITRLKLPYDQVIEEFGRWTHVSYSPRHRRQAIRYYRENGKKKSKPFA